MVFRVNNASRRYRIFIGSLRSQRVVGFNDLGAASDELSWKSADFSPDEPSFFFIFSLFEPYHSSRHSSSQFRTCIQAESTEFLLGVTR